jgi:hypothetical protein
MALMATLLSFKTFRRLVPCSIGGYVIPFGVPRYIRTLDLLFLGLLVFVPLYASVCWDPLDHYSLACVLGLSQLLCNLAENICP